MQYPWQEKMTEIKGIKLNLGSGSEHLEGYINADLRYNPGVDMRLDLTAPHLPFQDNSVSEVRMHHVLEHILDVPPLMEELYRILEPGGKLEIFVPYFTNFQAFTQLQHYHGFYTETLNAFTAKRQERYTDHIFVMERSYLMFTSGFPKGLVGFLGRLGARLFEWFASRHPTFYQTTWLSYLNPADQIHFILRKADSAENTPPS